MLTPSALRRGTTPLGRRLTALGTGLTVGLLVAAASATGAAASDDTYFADQWGLSRIGAPDAWATAKGDGVTVTIMSTGVLATHPDLSANLVPGVNRLDSTKAPTDDNGSGTRLAGIVAATTDNGVGIAGVAPNARVKPVKVLNSNGNAGDINAWLDSLQAAAGSPVILIDVPADLTPDRDADLRRVLRACWSSGSIVVVPAGDTAVANHDLTDTPAIEVTATTKTDNNAQTQNVNGAAGMWGIAAPGGERLPDTTLRIKTTSWATGDVAGYSDSTGTALAAAHVAGAAADLLGLGLSHEKVVERLLSTARDLGDPGHDAVYGAGMLDLAKAASLGGPPTTTTVAAQGATTTKTTSVTTTTTKGAATGGQGIPAGVLNRPTSSGLPGVIPANRAAGPDVLEEGVPGGDAQAPTARRQGTQGQQALGLPGALGVRDDTKPWGLLALGAAALCATMAAFSLTLRRLALSPDPLEATDAIVPAGWVPSN